MRPRPCAASAALLLLLLTGFFVSTGLSPAAAETATPGDAAAASAGDAQVTYLAATCGLCHGPSANAALPALEGHGAEEVAAALADYRDKRRASAIMQAVTFGLDDATLAALAARVVAGE